VVRDRSLPGAGGRKARSRTSARKRGSVRLTVVKDPGAEDLSTGDPGDGGFGAEGSGGAECGVGPGGWKPDGTGPRGGPPSGGDAADGDPVGGDVGDWSSAGAGLYDAEPYGGGFGGESSGAEVFSDAEPYGGGFRGESSGAEGSGGAEPEGQAPGGQAPAGEEAARVICLRLLTSGPRTRAQLATALRKRRIPGEVADAVLGRFAEVGLIDDAAFARAWVESRHHGRGLARRALAAELRERGVADGEVKSAVSLLGPEDELAAARQLVAKRVAASRGKPMPVRARQLMGMLARKGYPAGLAAQAVREALEQDQADSTGSSTDLAWISEDGSGDDWS
jgi:regulatory protein